MTNQEDQAVSMRKISVGLYGNTNDPELEQRIAEIESFLTQNGGFCHILRQSVEIEGIDVLVEFQADIPAWFTRQHHSFDSRLNSTTDGFGAGWVLDR